MPSAIEVTGVEQLLKVLQQFPPKLQKQAVRPAARDGAKMVLAKAKEFAPVDVSGKFKGRQLEGGTHLRDTLKVRANPGRKRGTIEFRIFTGTRKELGIPNDEKGYYPFALEYGSLAHQPIKFMEPAYHHTKEAVIETVRARVLRSLAGMASSG